MTASKVVRSRGSVMAVTANAEVLFGPQGQVTNFTRQFSNRARAAVAARAPSNSRPTWGHEPAARGKSLRASFTANTEPRPRGLKVYAAVGSSARYSAFVDQGTGIYAGNAPWEARILPPWTQGSPSLYEATWRPAGPEGNRVAGVMIKGQRPQHFFENGLHDAFMSVGIATAKVPSASIRGGVESFPESLARTVTAATEADAAFNASLAEWRSWRDAAWTRGEALGTGQVRVNEYRRRETVRDARRQANYARLARNKPSPQKVREQNRLRQQKRRDRIVDKKRQVSTRMARKEAERARFLKAVIDKYGSRVDPSSLRFTGNRWYVDVLERVQTRPGGPTALVPRPVKGRVVD